MTVVKHRIINDIDVIEISNPPVNAISAAVRTELLQTVNKLSTEKNIINIKLILIIIVTTSD